MIKERYDIAIQRIKEIITEETVEERFLPYFVASAQFILKIDNLLKLIESKKIEQLTLEQLDTLNKELYEDETETVYEKCFANPEFAVDKLGEEYGQLLCYVFAANRNMISNAFQGKLEEITLRMELFIEIYNQFEDRENLTKKSIHDMIHSFEKDNSEIFMTNRIDEIINPENDFAIKIVMESDLEDLRYLYKYGESISENEIETAKFLNTLSQEKIDKIASVYTEGYRLGFINTGKDLSIKKAVDIRYYIGFERIIRAAIKQFENMGLKPVIYKGGYESTKINKQYWFDHKFDDALFFDKGYVQRKLEVATTAFENRKKTAALMAGPAVVEVFGENPFEPESKKEALQLSKEQQKLKVEYAREYTQIVQKYIKGDERSFTIIAFPLPEIGMDYEELFEETVKINCLDQDKYRKVQQSIIDALDKADFVRVEGKGNNRTYITVNMHELNNPEKETNFENCLADVNIPLGEVFTSPKLTGTNGVLHVSQVYLNELKYNDLEITFENGCIKDYTCKNFETEEENKKYIKENVMFNHDTLPIGEFAIGTNTTAYVMANKYDIVYKLPILIVEKMGPHFAVGDTCYSWEEDVKTFNPDGKEIVAKENEISALRNKD